MSEQTNKTTIQVRQVKSGPQAYIECPAKKGTQTHILSEAKLSRELADLFLKSPNSLKEKEVEYALEGGQVQRVWEAGKAWDRQAAAAAVPRDGDHRRQGGDRGGWGDQRRGGPGVGNANGGRPDERRQVGGGGPGSLNTGERFENPYNFIPAPPREPGHPTLGDHEPDGHHRYHSNLWSGRIRVELTTKTPLLIPNLGRDIANGHRIYGVRVDQGGAPYLPPTSLKGALRAAYEAMTNSRMGILDGHDERLALRMQANQSLALIPCRIVADGNDGLAAQLLPGQSAIGYGGKPQGRGVDCLMYGAWLPRYRKYRADSQPRPDKHLPQQALKYSDGKLPQHGEKVFVRIEQRPHRFERFSYSAVIEIARAIANQTCPTGWVEGFVYASGPNIMNKHEERVFLLTNRAQVLAISPRVASGWMTLVRDYRAVHADELAQRRQRGQQPSDYLGHEPGQTGFSRHVYAAGAENLAVGTLCYARIETAQDGTPIRLVDLYPVSITRMLYKQSPRQCLSDTLIPAKDRMNLSPADRVFGWVHQSGNGSHKGQLRIGCITCEGGAAAIEHVGGPEGRPLAILGQPKPAQARFYAAKNPQSEPLDPGVEKASAYAPGTGLRGRKVYLHQPQAEWAHYWDTNAQGDGPKAPLLLGHQSVHREWQSHNDERTDQNRSVTAWIKPGTRFNLDIDVINLSDAELGALLWLLNLPADHYLRIGGGKPLGFGSIHLNATNLNLRTGESLAQDYRAFGVPQNGTGRIGTWAEAATVLDVFKTALPRAVGEPTVEFKELTVVRAFRNSAKGGRLPVHYPRTDQQTGPVGESFKWFVENEKDDRKRRERYPLPALAADERGLPILREN